MKKMKFSFVDAVIVLAVIAVLAVGIKLLPGISAGGEQKEVYFTVLASKSDEGIDELVNVGDEVQISFSERAFATVVGVSAEPSEEYEYFQPKGVYMTHVLEGKSDVKVLLKCMADVSDTKIATGDVPIRVGAEMPVRGKGYTLKGYVIELEERE